jgi:UDP-galactopyranose mutase
MLDFLVVGAGLYGSVMARELTNAGKKVLVAEARNRIGCNLGGKRP